MISKPKIALMSYSMDNRPAKGTALYTRKLIENLLNDDRYDFYLVHYDKVDDPLYKKAQEIIMPEVHLLFGTRFVRQLLFFWKYRKEKFDIIHWFQPRLYPFFWFAPARSIVVTAHGAGDITAPSHFVFSRMVFNFIMCNFNKHIDACIAVSNFARDEIVEYYKIVKEKVFVTYNGGGEDYEPIPKKEAQEIIKLNYLISNPYILDISRLVPHKNVSSLVRAYIKTKETYNIEQDLVIVGYKGYSYKEVSALVESSAFAPPVHFIEYVKVEDLNALYSGADLFVFPSLNEGFGFPIIESMASGTPVITSNITSMPEVSQDAALLVDPNNINDIVEKIYRVLSDHTLSDSLREKGLRRAKDFTWKQTSEATKKIYEKMLQT